jgi:hypothetical protein
MIAKIFQPITYRLKYLSKFLFRRNSWKKIPKVDILLLCHDVNRGGEIDGKAFSPLIDILQLDLQEKGLSCAQFAYPESKIVGSTAWGNPFHATSAWALSCLVSCAEFRFFSRVVEVLTFGKFSLVENFGKEAFYKKLINITKPRAVIGVEPYPMLCKVCRDKQIPIVEIFHGFGYTEKVFTYLWKEDPTPVGVLALDSTSSKTFSSDYYKSMGIWCEYIGHPYYRRIIGNKTRPLESSLYNNESCFLKGNSKKILYSMSWGYAGDHSIYSEYKDIIKNGICPSELLEVIKNLCESHMFYFRLHPVHLRNPNKYQFVFDFLDDLKKNNPNVEWENASKTSLALIYKDIDCQISMRSETCYDASFFGVKSLLLCPSLRNGRAISGHFSDLADAGFVEYWDGNIDSLINWVQTTKKTKPSALGIEEMEMNFKRSINRMLGGNS